MWFLLDHKIVKEIFHQLAENSPRRLQFRKLCCAESQRVFLRDSPDLHTCRTPIMKGGVVSSSSWWWWCRGRGVGQLWVGVCSSSQVLASSCLLSFCPNCCLAWRQISLGVPLPLRHAGCRAVWLLLSLFSLVIKQLLAPLLLWVWLGLQVLLYGFCLQFWKLVMCRMILKYQNLWYQIFML